MNIVINNKLNKPLYEQIYEQISAQIINGDLPPDYCLPSIRAVALELGISVITVKKAYEMLENNKFIYTRAGKGCFVQATKSSSNEIRRVLAEERLRQNLDYFRNLNITQDELQSLITKLYSESDNKKP